MQSLLYFRFRRWLPTMLALVLGLVIAWAFGMGSGLGAGRAVAVEDATPPPVEARGAFVMPQNAGGGLVGAPGFRERVEPASAWTAARVPRDAPAILGVALTEGREPLAGARVRSTLVLDAERFALPDSFSDALGRFRVDVSSAVGLEGEHLEDAEVEFYVTCEGWLFDVEYAWFACVMEPLGDGGGWSILEGREFPAGEDFEDDLDFVAVGARGVRFEGRVVDAQGRPAGGATVWVEVNDRSDPDDTGSVVADIEADTNGRFDLPVEWGERIEELGFSLHAAHAGLGEAELALETRELFALDPIELRLKTRGVISGRLVSTTGSHVAGARVWICKSDWDWLRPDEATWVNVGAHGEFTFRGLPDGDWNLWTMDQSAGPFATGTGGILIETECSIVHVEALAPAGVRLGGAVLAASMLGRGAGGWRALDHSWDGTVDVDQRGPGSWDVVLQRGMVVGLTVTAERSWYEGRGPHSWYGSATLEEGRPGSPSRVWVDLEPRGESTFELVLVDPAGVRIEGWGVVGQLLDPVSSLVVARVEAGKLKSVPSGEYRLELEAGSWLFERADTALVSIPWDGPSVCRLNATAMGGRLCLDLSHAGAERSWTGERFDVRLTPAAGEAPVRARWSFPTGCTPGICATVRADGECTSNRAFEPGVWHCELVPFRAEDTKREPIEFDVTLVRGETTRVSVELAKDGASSRVRLR